MNEPAVGSHTFDHSIVATDHDSYVQALGEWEEKEELAGQWPTPNLHQLLGEIGKIVPHIANGFDESQSGLGEGEEVMENTRWVLGVLLALLRYGIEAEYNARVDASAPGNTADHNNFDEEMLADSQRRWERARAMSERHRVLGMELDLVMITLGGFSLENARRTGT